MFFSHESEHSRGEMNSCEGKSDYEVKECQKDGQGRFVLLKVLNQCSF